MKKLLFLFLLFPLLLFGQIKRPFKIVYTGSSLVQTVNINFDDTNRSVTGYNTVYGAASNALNLLNTSSVATGYNLQFISGNGVTAENEGGQTDPFGRFSAGALQYMLNTGDAAGFTYRFVNLNPARNYRLKFAAVQSYNDANDATTVTINGTPYNFGGPNLANVVYPTTDIFYSVNLPASGIITMVFTATNGSGFACVNAMILEEYTP